MSSAGGLQSLVHDIATGFEFLAEQLGALQQRENDLRRRLALVNSKSTGSDSARSSDGDLSAWQGEIVKQLSDTPDNRTDKMNGDAVIATQIEKAKHAIGKLQADMAQATISPRKCPVQHGKVTSPEKVSSDSTPRRCPVAHKPVRPAFEDMEKDFTTQGKPSSLECPFATMTKNGVLDTTTLRDPIAAEFHADALSAQSLDEARACGKCPIRFLDKHSPEELAEYFEKHKHELPRSHEICVKRYQTNEQQIRQLDAKYGNIVNMIQGLGKKHKPYLQSDIQGAESDQKSSDAAVQKWANGVDTEVKPSDPEPEERIGHFEKPLREVRVGESPSRPWGIHVPADHARPSSTASSQQEPQANIDTTLPPKPTERAEHTPNITTSLRSQSRASQTSKQYANKIIFNGPVFIGYPPEQAAAFLHQLGQNQQS